MGIEVIRDEMADLVDPSLEPELVADGLVRTPSALLGQIELYIGGQTRPKARRPQ